MTSKIDRLTVEDLAEVLGMKPGSLSVRLCRRPWSLPPVIKTNRRSKPVWMKDTVETWMRSLEVRHEEA